MKTKVIVTLRAETQVEIEVEHQDDEEPTDLTKEDARRARNLADVDWRWDVQGVTVVNQ